MSINSCVGNVFAWHFGEPEHFAVAIYRQDDCQESDGLLVRVEFILRGERLGNSASFYEITDIFERFERMCSFERQRECCSFFAASESDLFNGISQVLLGISDEEEFRGERNLERFKLWFHSTLGDCWMIGIACGSNMKILYTKSEAEELRTVTVDRVEFGLALSSAEEQLKKMAMPTQN